MKDRFIFIAAALESIELIQSYIEGYDLTGFLADRKTQDAVFAIWKSSAKRLRTLVLKPCWRNNLICLGEKLPVCAMF
ncbi:hypothetical protein [Methylotuvimicrobium sp. KM1]|uniref:hypothetical protein n=1 Tax=Methylotuvimicrobium sp. KM1 TaxID=3377707 RepID=UPI00384F24D4